MKILTYELQVHSTPDGPVPWPRYVELNRMPTDWSEYLKEAAENLTDLLPDGLYVVIDETREE